MSFAEERPREGSALPSKLEPSARILMSGKKFGRNRRLLSQKDFEYLRKGARSLRSILACFYFKTSRLNANETRIAFSVSRKVGKSVVRNRIRRLLREQLRTSGFTHLGVDVLMVIHPKRENDFATRKDYETALLKSVLEIWNKISLEVAPK
jgi:ribonuclease P protein component